MFVILLPMYSATEYINIGNFPTNLDALLSGKIQIFN